MDIHMVVFKQFRKIKNLTKVLFTHTIHNLTFIMNSYD